jgi:retron-type reverse transcriptase
MDGKKATGVDNITKNEYEANSNENLKILVERLKRKKYKPQPSLRVYIPKVNGKMRPLGMAAYEDKLVQAALGRVLMAVYEPKFRSNSSFLTFEHYQLKINFNNSFMKKQNGET